MAILLLKKSYRHKDLKEIKFDDLWNSHGVFTTMRVIGKPARILFFKNHINNLFKSLKVYKINKKNSVYGFQFHPESFLTENGNIIIKKILSA